MFSVIPHIRVPIKFFLTFLCPFNSVLRTILLAGFIPLRMGTVIETEHYIGVQLKLHVPSRVSDYLLSRAKVSDHRATPT